MNVKVINIFALKRTRSFFSTVPGVWNASSKITVIICPCLAENILFARPSWFINKYMFNFLIYNKRSNNYYSCTLPLLSHCLIVGRSHTPRPAGDASERWTMVPFMCWHTKGADAVSADKFPDTVDKRVPEYTRALQLTIHILRVKLKFRRVLWASTALSRVRSQKHNGEARCAHKSINPQYKGRFRETAQWTKKKRVIILLLFKPAFIERFKNHVTWIKWQEKWSLHHWKAEKLLKNRCCAPKRSDLNLAMVARSTNVALGVQWAISWALHSTGIYPAGQFYAPLQPANLETLKDGVWQHDVKLYREMIERV